MNPDKTKEELTRELQDLQQKYSFLNNFHQANNEDKTHPQDILNLREYFLSAIIENQPGLVWLKDINSRFLAVNTCFSNTCGLDNPNSLVGKSDFEIWPQELASKYVADDLAVINSKMPKTVEEPISDHGNIKWFETFKAPVINNKGTVIGTTGYSRDITERKEAELLLKDKNREINEKNEEYKQLNEELIKAKEKAEESDRLKTAFLQNMSHEIRTPLNAISGFSSLLDNPEMSTEKRNSFISIIQNSCTHLVSIVTDILTISSLETRQEKINLDPVGINNLIVDLLAIFKQQAINQNISLYAKQQLNNKQSEIYTDQTKITQILSNLISNALKFTHEGFIEFGYEIVETHNRGHLKNELQNIPFLKFYVKDSGIGIKQEFHQKIFERFRQADKSINKLYGGTGLGLAISKAFVELLGGEIWVESEIEKGSTFYFTIPYNPVNEIDKITTPLKQNINFKTVLVAEDEEYNFLFIEELLINMDIKLIHTKDGKETVETFKTNPNIDLILMDIKMPIMDGHEAAKIIKGLKHELPIIAQSAYALEHERSKYQDIFDDYLTKPINGNDLKQLVKKYIDKQTNKLK